MQIGRAMNAALTAVALCALSVGCASPTHSVEANGGADARLRQASFTQDEVSAERMIVETGAITVAVASVDDAFAEVAQIVAAAGGDVAQSSATSDAGVRMTCRVPAARLEEVMDAVAELGAVKSRSTGATDVTEEYDDLEARLANNRALRDRLRGLLDRATDVKEVIEVERELTRVQSLVDSMQARLDRLQSQVARSSLAIRIEPKQKLGPLGWVGYGLWWGVSKLFVIR